MIPLGLETSDTPPFVTRVRIRNFKSIARCDVRLKPLTILVGPNASGKSNFLDALNFLAEALNSSVDNALRERGGINEVRRKSSGHPTHFMISVQCKPGPELTADYSLELASRERGSYAIARELCIIRNAAGIQRYEVRNGEVISTNTGIAPSVSKDRLYLTKVLAQADFERLHDFLTGLRFYDLDPGEMRDLQPPDIGDALAADGWNCASVWRSLESNYPQIRDRLQEYLSRIAREVSGAQYKAVGPYATLEFLQEVAGARHPWKFYALSMSEGTIRAFGALLSYFQPGTGNDRIPFVAIEEPETGVHPAAMSVILDAMLEVSAQRQLLATSHSPDLLDRSDLPVDSILAVSLDRGRSIIGPIDDTGRSVLRDRLYTVGELLRSDELRPSASKTIDR